MAALQFQRSRASPMGSRKERQAITAGASLAMRSVMPWQVEQCFDVKTRLPRLASPIGSKYLREAKKANRSAPSAGVMAVVPCDFAPAGVHAEGGWLHSTPARSAGVKSRDLRVAKSDALLPPAPLSLWQLTQPRSRTNCSPREASPVVICASRPLLPATARLTIARNRTIALPPVTVPKLREFRASHLPGTGPPVPPPRESPIAHRGGWGRRRLHNRKPPPRSQ